MQKLNTINKHFGLNEVYATDEPGAGRAYHKYEIKFMSEVSEGCPIGGKATIEFQHGGRKIIDSVHGVTNEDLLEIVRHRLQCFQTSEYVCRENAIALTHIEDALLWLNKRVEDRAEKGVLGTNSKG
jgi:hypothetical protein